MKILKLAVVLFLAAASVRAASAPAVVRSSPTVLTVMWDIQTNDVNGNPLVLSNLYTRGILSSGQHASPTSGTAWVVSAWMQYPTNRVNFSITLTNYTGFAIARYIDFQTSVGPLTNDSEYSTPLHWTNAPAIPLYPLFR